MSDLFGRVARVVVAVDDQGATREALDVRTEDGFRVAFQIRRTTELRSNQGEVTIWNLSPGSRAKLGQVSEQVTLEAGYEGRSDQIWRTDQARIQHRKVGVDWITTIQGGDGRRRLDQVIGLSTGEATTCLELFQQIEPNGLVSAAARQLMANTTYERWAFIGRVQDALRKIARKARIQISFQLGRAQVVAPGETLGSFEVDVLSSDTGLLGSPERVYDPKRPNRFIVRGSALMNPTLAPSSRVSLESVAHSGAFKLMDVTHRGDSYGSGESWTTDFEGVSVG